MMHKKDRHLERTTCRNIERKLLCGLFEEHRSWLYRSIRSRTGDAEAAHDLVQETFLRAQQAAMRINLSTGSAAYLQRIAHNLTLRYLSKRTEAIVSDTLDTTVASSCERENDAVKYSIQTALDSLPDQQRQVAEMRLYTEIGYEKISENLGISVRTAKRRMQEARTSLRKRLSR